MNLTTTDSYRTSDLGRSAYLMCRGCRFLTQLAPDGKRVYLHFERSRAMRLLLELPEDPAIGAQSFLNCFESAKLAIAEARRNGGANG